MGPRLLAALSALCVHLGGAPASGLPSPSLVRFKPNFFLHILEWEPGHNDSARDRYEVEYRKYGVHDNWTSVVHCKEISSHTCDLTMETLPQSIGYLGRVRAVFGNLTSNWTRTSRFTPQEVRLPPPGVELQLEGNTIHVTLHVPFKQWWNMTLRYEDVFKYSRAYRIHITRPSDNLTFTLNEESTEFDLPSLAWGQQYCLTVTAEVKSRPNLGIRSEAHCVSLPEEERTGIILLITFSCIFVLCMLLVFGNILVCMYIGKPAETPNSLVRHKWFY